MLIYQELCPVREGKNHQPIGQSRMRFEEPIVRYQTYCVNCQHAIFQDEIRGKMTRDIRYGEWYHEHLIIQEWP